MKRLNPATPDFWPWYASRIRLAPKGRQAIMREVLRQHAPELVG